LRAFLEEYVTDALVLTKEPAREYDSRYTFFAERFGKISAKAISSRRITSKLAGHLEPGTMARVRFIDKGSPQVVDALKSFHVDITLEDLKLLNDLLPEMQADAELWQLLVRGPFSWNSVLQTLGWDPRGARCALCGSKAKQFFVERQEFLCDACVSKMRKNAVLFIKVDS
jgi:recombinational DNA repair protein (RecF pathway)